MILRAFRQNRFPLFRFLSRRWSSSTTASATPNLHQSPKSNPLVPYFDGIHELGSNGVEVEMDSWSTVQQLHGSGFTVKQAEVITDLLAWILRVRLNEFKRSLVTQPQAEYDISMMSEIFEEIQSSFSAAIAKDSIEIRGLQDKYVSEVSRLLDTLKDNLSASKTELAIGMNSYKADSMEEAQRVGMRLHQEDSKLTVRIGAFKTATENVKLRAISTFSLVLCIACVLVAAKARAPKKPKHQEELVLS